MTAEEIIQSMKLHLKNAYDSVESKGGSVRRLPIEYQEVEYIESTKIDYIDTDYTLNDNSVMHFKYIPNVTTGNSLFGFSNIKSGYYASGLIGKSLMSGIIKKENSKYVIANNNVINSEVNLIVTNTKMTYNDNEITTNYSFSGGKLTLFKNLNYPTDSFSGKFYSLKIYDNEILVCNFIPCYRKSDNKIGLYDLVNNKFYTNQGTGTFLKGEDVIYNKNLENLSSAIESIPSEEWQPQPDWWDIDKILEEDTEDYAIKIIALIRDVQTTSMLQRRNMEKFKTSDGQIYTSEVNHTWDTTKDKPCSLGYKTRYVIWYSNNTNTSFNSNLPYGTMFLIIKGNIKYVDGRQINYYNTLLECIKYKNCNNLNSISFGNYSTQKILFDNVIFSNITTLSSLFNNGKGKPMNDNKLNLLLDNIDFSKITDLYNAFNNSSGEKLNVKNTYNVTNFNSAFSFCNFKKIEELDFNSATNVSNAFYNYTNLLEILSVKNIKISGLNFNPCILLNRDTLIRILNALYDYSESDTHTITLGSTNLAKLTEEEIAIATSKGWNVS